MESAVASRSLRSISCIGMTRHCHLQVSTTDTPASDPQTAAVREPGKQPCTSSTQQAAAQPGAPQQAEPGWQMAGGSGTPGHDADPLEAGGAGAESPARGEHRQASQPRGQVPAALQSMSREGAGTSAGGATGAALQGQPGAPGSQQASSSRQGSGATAAPSRCLAHSLWTTGPVFLA